MNQEKYEAEKPSYSTKAEELISSSHLTDVPQIEAPEFEIELQALKEKIDELNLSLETKKQMLNDAIATKAKHEDIQIIVAELLAKQQALKDLEIQLAERITIKTIHNK